MLFLNRTFYIRFVLFLIVFVVEKFRKLHYGYSQRQKNPSFITSQLIVIFLSYLLIVKTIFQELNSSVQKINESSLNSVIIIHYPMG